MRGKPQAKAYMSAPLRITPADAGKTLSRGCSTHRPEDHPRRCGENTAAEAVAKLRRESPPQVRGKRGTKPTMTKDQRITPAGAGKTQGKIFPPREIKDHPRRCGENDNRNLFAFLQVGSPPQVRGKQSDPQAIVQHLGITPAGAGKTANFSICVDGAGDHPRRCGENFPADSPVEACTGSPPQVRGKRGGHGYGQTSRRITPAGAGKTIRAIKTAAQTADHPRRCGENHSNRYADVCRRGSPPQVRGKPADCCMMQGMARITPAGAGKTSDKIQSTCAIWDHPRRCGENCMWG